MKAPDNRNTHRYRIAALAAALLMLAMPAGAATISLTFDSLPSSQGWTYDDGSLDEDVAFAVVAGQLRLSTTGLGRDAYARYQILNIVNSSQEMSLSFTARVLNREQFDGATTGYGLSFWLRDISAEFRVGLTDDAVFINDQRFALNTTASHDYVLNTFPGGDYELLVDNTLIATGNGAAASPDNVIYFGDNSVEENIEAEITALTFTSVLGAAPDIEVLKSVNNAFPMPNEPVEFTINVSNIGIDVATDLLVVDQLPAALRIPPGTAAFPSVGSYDPVSGEWLLGNLQAGSSAVLTVPAVVSAAEAPDCIINVASSNHPRDTDVQNNQASALVHRSGVERCVDLDVSFGISVGPLFALFPECDSKETYNGDVTIANRGPDAARNVVVTIAQNPVVGPNLRFDDADCDNAPAAQCSITEIAAGATVRINVTSDTFQSYATYQQTLSVSASSSDADYDLSNNNPSNSGTAGGFSSCKKIDLGLGDVGFPLGGGCFIATAAYGTALHEHLDALRDFRDRFMLTNPPGRALVNFYYRYSPPLADYIAERDWLRAVVRGALAPIVYTILYPIPATLLLASLIALIYRRRRGVRGSGVPPRSAKISIFQQCGVFLL